MSRSEEDRIGRLERQVEVLLAKIEAQAAKIEAQAAEIGELKRWLGQNSSNSNKPPSSDSPKTAPSEMARRPDPVERRAGSQATRGRPEPCCLRAG